MVSAAILVVDDEWEQGEIMTYLLQDAGYGARYAPNGRVALQSLNNIPAALVITDYMMPVMDGCQLLQAMRGIASLASIPALIVSALPEEVVRTKCKPATAFLRRPFRPEQLLDAVRNLLDLSKHR